jgi:hypothetical protein
VNPAQLSITDALVDFLAAQTGRPVGWATAPIDGEGVPVDPPYAIVYALPGGSTWGPGLTGPDEGARLPYQVTSVGLRGDQAAWMADKVRHAMLGRTNGVLVPLVASGVTVLDRELTSFGGQDREGDVVSVPDSFVVHVTL